MQFRLKRDNAEFEFEFEGDEKTLRAVVMPIADKFFNAAPPTSGSRGRMSTGEEKSGSVQGRLLEGMTTANIAARLRGKSGPDLVIAAAARLTFFDGMAAFNRSELLKEMSSATNLFEENHRKNLSHYLGRLFSTKKLIERSKDLYALSSEARGKIAMELEIPDDS